MTMPRIVELRAYHVRIPLKKTIRHASHVRKESDNIVVSCRLDDGTIGFGEGAPRDYVTGETLETSLDLLRRTDWAGQLEPVRDFGEAVAMLRRFTIESAMDDPRGCLGNAARCASELAMLDAFGRRFGVSLQTLPAYLPDAANVYKLRKRCRYSGAITSKRNMFREFLSAVKVFLGWFKDCKIKVGTEGQDDPARLRLFRRVLGPRMDFRVDANEAWTPENVVEKIRELEPFRISAVEQPVPHEQVACLADARRQVETPIMLDESLCSRYDAERAIADKTCDLFNIRLSKCGGLIPSIELAAIADRAGLGYQLGCQIGESGILSAAGRAFACSISNIRHVEGSYDHFLVKERLTKENLTFEFAGIADSLTGPGLGMNVAPQRLARVTEREILLHG